MPYQNTTYIGKKSSLTAAHMASTMYNNFATLIQIESIRIVRTIL